MSVRIFYGEDRVETQKEIRKLLGEYEVVEGEELSKEMMATVFLGASLFVEKRKIVVKDLSLNTAVWEDVIKYIDSPHDIVIWEAKLDKRTVIYKELAAQKVEVREFKVQPKVDYRQIFGIYTTALREGKRAVKMLEEIETEEDPYKMVGLFATQAMKNFAGRPKEKAILKELAKLDLDMKSSTVEPWNLVKSFLIRLSSLQ